MPAGKKAKSKPSEYEQDDERSNHEASENGEELSLEEEGETA
jgi:hypothetical protein